MITMQKLKAYRAFRGDIDAFARSKVEDRSGITDHDWRAIDELQQALFLVRVGRAAPEFAAAVEERLRSISADEQTREALRGLAV